MDDKTQSILMELIKDRKYTIEQTSEKKWVVFSTTENKRKVILLFTQPKYWANENISKEKAEAIADAFMIECTPETEQENDCILVCPQVLFARCSFYEDEFLEVISGQTLAFNPTENENVPKHTLFKRQQRTNGQEETELYPIISVNDPIVRWSGFKQGDVIKIEREYCGETYYRIVSN